MVFFCRKWFPVENSWYSDHKEKSVLNTKVSSLGNFQDIGKRTRNHTVFFIPFLARVKYKKQNFSKQAFISIGFDNFRDVLT